MSSTHPPETNQGIVTSFLPISTAFPTVSGCSSQIYSAFSYIAFDPLYGQSIDTALTCLPEAATLWWEQTAAVNTLTVTNLAPLVCPDLYTTASTSIVNSLTTFVACCPQSYTFLSTVSMPNQGQCRSPLAIGQVLTYAKEAYPASGWVYNTTTAASVTFVTGLYLNGLVFASTTTTSSSTLNTSSTSSAGASQTGSNQNNVSSSEGLSTGANIGIGVGVSLAVLGLISIIAAIILIKRHRKSRLSEKRIPMQHNAFVPPELATTDDFRYSQKPSHRASTMTGTTHVGSPRIGDTIWEGSVVSPRSHNELGPGQHEAIDHYNVHELSGTPRSNPS